MVAIWICLCAFLNGAGWLLSALHLLNRTGYLLAFVGAGVGLLIWWRRAQRKLGGGVRWPKLRRRFRSGFPLFYLLLAGLAFLGGVLHAPANYDGLTYRIPRVLHWLAEEQWHWIHTEFPRLNNRATGFEWLSAPLIAFTQTDRLLFLINTVAFFLLPGLCFSVLCRMGVRKRVAAVWMWLLPTGYCYLLQAGSIGNDLVGSFYALAAVDFALRARASRSVADLWLSILAAGLLSSGKTSNLPLLLPWAVAIAPALGLAFKRPLATAAICLAAMGASFLPMAYLNAKHVGDWTGLAAEGLQLSKGEPVVRVVNNTVLLTIQNFAPPVFPMAGMWNQSTKKIIPAGFAKKIEADFEPAGAHWQLAEMQVEEFAGLGFGLSVLLMISVAAAWRWRRVRPGSGINWSHCALVLAPWVALLAFMLKSNLSTAARLASPYFALLVPLLLLPAAHSRLVRARWWRWLAGVLLVPAVILLVVSPPRPLWPTQTVLTKLAAGESPHPLISRALTVYSVYGIRSYGLAPVVETLPAEAKIVGLVSFDDTETGLWRPFGSRRFLHITSRDTREDLLAKGIQYAVLNGEWFPSRVGMTLEEWLTRFGARIETTIPLRLRAGREPSHWHVVRLN